VEERVLGPRERAALERHPQRAGTVIGFDGEPLDVVEVQSSLGGGAGDLEDRQVTGDAPALPDLVLRGTGDVVRNCYGARFDALGVQAQLGLAEVQDVACVVAVAEQDAAASVGCLGHPVDLPGGRRSEHVAACGGRCQPGAYQAGEGRVVS